jgi:hypothetical protein
LSAMRRRLAVSQTVPIKEQFRCPRIFHRIASLPVS